MNHLEILKKLPELQIFSDKEYNLNTSFRINKFDDNIPIVFLHGFNGNSKSWAFQFLHFRDKRSVIAIDAPGFGKSDAADLNMFEIAKLVNNLLTNLGIKKFVSWLKTQKVQKDNYLKSIGELKQNGFIK